MISVSAKKWSERKIDKNLKANFWNNKNTLQLTIKDLTIKIINLDK